MEPKTEEQMQKERDAVEAMRNAKSNMDKALARISTLELALKSAADRIAAITQYLPDNAYPWDANGQTKHSLKSLGKAYELEARKAL